MLAVGHNLADHVIGQTDHQAEGKAAPSGAEVADGVSPRRGWGACLGHVAQYHLVMATLLALVWAVLPLQMSFTGLAAGLTVSIVTHVALSTRTGSGSTSVMGRRPYSFPRRADPLACWFPALAEPAQ
ncbi:hypothetical protein OG566_01740 [Streptomyces sp. NBC_01353]|nr:hypothetical protein [Streptomyces sp. NBC_01353]